MLMNLFILVLIQGLVSSEDEMENEELSCFDIVIGNSEEISPGSLPNAEELLLRCPVMKEFVVCQVRRALPIYQETLLSIKRFTDELCDETSEFHNAYINNVDCMGPLVDKRSMCEETASDVLHEYITSGYAFQSILDLDEGLDEEQLENMKDYQVYAESHCLLSVYPYTCVAKKILETCGSGAYDTYVEMITRTRFAYGYCDENMLKYFIKGYTDFLLNENKSSEIHIFNDLLKIKAD